MENNNLIFFNKEGDHLNFKYDNNTKRYSGDILFHENSSDTFKTYGLYSLEKIPSFEYELPGELTLDKFQLFNEYGLHFYSGRYSNQQITKIEPVNNDSNYYSKWIYGDGFEQKFKKGELIKFDQELLEFSNLNMTYVVVSTKKNAILIISTFNNKDFESTYKNLYEDPNYFLNKTISGVNAVGVYNFIDSNYENVLSDWSEPDFYDKYYLGQKLNFINTEKNDDIIGTVDDLNYYDPIHYEYYTDGDNGLIDSKLIIEVITKTNLPVVYSGSLNIEDKRLELESGSNFPIIFKPGTAFNIVGSDLNTIDFTVAPIPSFSGNTQLTFYEKGSQVIWNNKIYESIISYTQSYSDPLTKDITPDNISYWSSPTYIPVNESTNNENLLNIQIYIKNDTFRYEFGYTQSIDTTLASAAEKYKETLKIFDIDLFFENSRLRADLMFPSKYSIVNFYHTNVSNDITKTKTVNEKLVGVKEQLRYETNYNFSENFKETIVFTDIDEFGIRITINGMVYQEEVAYVFNGNSIDMERTIDRTLRNWLTRHYIYLKRLGILADLKYSGNFVSVFYDSIVLTTQYPNVPMNISKVEVGTTADFFITHSTVLFPDVVGTGTQSFPYLEFTINNKIYSVESVNSGTITNVIETLKKWTDQYRIELLRLGIKVTHINNLLRFDKIDPTTSIKYTIKTGNLNLPGLLNYTITNRFKGNIGSLITSNQIKLPEDSVDSFKEVGFATGMVVTINNTDFIFNNQEYNIQYLNDTSISLSYQGPFWGLTDSGCNVSPFTTLAFNSGFGQTACDPETPITGLGGPFDKLMFDDLAFSIQWNPNTYTFNTYDLNTYPGTDNLNDIIYIQLTDSLYLFGDDVIVLDAFTGNFIKSISIPSNLNPIKIVFNNINNYLYCLSKNRLTVINPLTNSVVNSTTFINDGFDIGVNKVNGDIYISYENSGNIDIFYNNNLISSFVPNKTISTGYSRSGRLVFNDFEKDMYVTTSGDVVIKIDGDLRIIQNSINIVGLTYSIYYEPVNESIYVYSTDNLWKISSGVTQSINVPYNGFNDIVFNNLTGNLDITDQSNDFTRLSLSDDSTLTSGLGNYGYLALNQFDGHVYLSSLSTDIILVIDTTSGTVVHTQPLGVGSTKIIYNPSRQSVFSIVPSLNSVVEVKVSLNNVLTVDSIDSDKVGENLYGTLSDSYEEKDNLWLKTREYIRKPRENFNGSVPVQYYWRWVSDNVPEMFLYDFSGEQLPTTGDYTYTGPKPLTNITLNKVPNKDVTKKSDPSYQQTVFNRITHTLSYIDDPDDISIEPEALQLFIGFKSEKEGALRSVLQLYKKEDISFDIVSDETTDISFELVDEGSNVYGMIKLNPDSTEFFSNRGLKKGQLITFNFVDTTNVQNQYLSSNNGVVYRIIDVFSKYITVEYSINFSNESTKIVDYPIVGETTYLKTTISVIDKEIGRFNVYGQTEVEDIRYKTDLNNEGKLIGPDETFIFKDYDIQEGGIDWKFLNIKRKELLTNKHLIYPYIGSYKSIINAINFFGYNDLQLNEYYKNINPGSENFHKLFKVEIPDIFDNSISGFNESDFIKGSFPNQNYEETNLFNLTYFITDKEGNNVLNYSVDEIIIKLQGLKYWLKRNIIPLTHNIKDILGVASIKQTNGIRHKLNKITIKTIKENMTPIIGKLSEAYLMPVNSGSTVYNCVISMFTIIPNVGTDKTQRGLVVPPKPFNGVELKLPDTYSIEVKTYKTYKEWLPFKSYKAGDKISYYEYEENFVFSETVGESFETSGVQKTKIYEATSDSKMENPTRYENVDEWSMNIKYTKTTIVKYKKEAYVYIGEDNSLTSIIPPNDPNNWTKISKWKEINYEPVQTIKEFRNSKNLEPFNFTVDSNLDPFITVNIISDNGYGVTYGDRKNYELRGLKDLTESIKNLDNIGPFKPITPII